MSSRDTSFPYDVAEQSSFNAAAASGAPQGHSSSSKVREPLSPSLPPASQQPQQPQQLQQHQHHRQTQSVDIPTVYGDCERLQDPSRISAAQQPQQFQQHHRQTQSVNIPTLYGDCERFQDPSRIPDDAVSHERLYSHAGPLPTSAAPATLPPPPPTPSPPSQRSQDDELSHILAMSSRLPTLQQQQELQELSRGINECFEEVTSRNCRGQGAVEQTPSPSHLAGGSSIPAQERGRGSRSAIKSRQDLSELLRDYMRRQGRSMSDLCNVIGRQDEDYMSRVLSGVTSPSQEETRKLAESLNLSFGSLRLRFALAKAKPEEQ